MGIVKQQILSMELDDGTEIVIEQHETGTIQVNIGPVAFGYSVEEFNEFVDCIENAHNELKSYKEGL